MTKSPIKSYQRIVYSVVENTGKGPKARNTVTRLNISPTSKSI